MTTNTTNHLHLSPRDRALIWWYRADKVTLSGVLTLALIIALGTGRAWLLTPHADRVALPTPALPIIIVASPIAGGPRPTPAPTPAAVAAAYVPNVLRRAVVAYDSPNGNVLGAIEQGRAYSVLARFGAEWLQADVAGSGVVWLRSDQVLDLPADLADLQPAPAPVVIERPIYIASQAAPVAAEQAVATPAPPQPTIAPQQMVLIDRNAWAANAAQHAQGQTTP